MVEFTVKLGTDNSKIDAGEAEQIVAALAAVGFNPSINVLVDATEGKQFQLLRTILENNEIGWTVVACTEIKKS